MKSFSQEDASRVATILHAGPPSYKGDHYRIRVENAEERRSLALELYPEVTLGKSRGMLVVVYTGNSHLQLHNCTGFVVSEELGEVTFVAQTDRHLSGLVVEQGASCSLYASISRELISTDFTQLGVEVMLSGVALSLVEDLLEPGQDSKE